MSSQISNIQQVKIYMYDKNFHKTAVVSFLAFLPSNYAEAFPTVNDCMMIVLPTFARHTSG